MAHDDYKVAHDDESAVEHVMRDEYEGQFGGDMNEVIKLKPLEDRIIIDTSETEWRMSRMLINDPSLIEDSEISERAKAEMIRYNSRHANNGRTDGKNETGIPIGEFFASFGTMLEQGVHHFNPSGETPVSDPSNPLQPNWQLAVENGSLTRIHGLIKSSYAASSRPSLKTAVRHWVRFCALYGISPFRPQVADNWDAKVTEEIILMMFLNYLLYTVGVQGSTCESYFSLMKGWHGSTSSLRRPPIEFLFCFSFICFSVCFRVCHSKTSFYWAGDQRPQEYRPRRRCEAGPAAPKPMASGNDVTFL